MSVDPSKPWAHDVMPEDYQEVSAAGEAARNACKLVIGQLFMEYGSLSRECVVEICEGIMEALRRRVIQNIRNLNDAHQDGWGIFDDDVSDREFAKTLHELCLAEWIKRRSDKRAAAIIQNPRTYIETGKPV